MCGIVYVKRSDDKKAYKKVLKRYHKQRNRGYEGFGFIALDDKNKIVSYERYMTESETEASMRESNSQHILFHHRYPTSTANLPEASHPIFVQHEELKHSYYVIHNGVISNDEELHDEHVEMGYKYTTEVQVQYKALHSGETYVEPSKFNDSEALAIEMARTIEGLQPVNRARGSIAIMVLQADKSGQNVKALYYGTNGGNPLTINEDKGSLCIASVGGTAIADNVIYRTDLKTNKTKKLKAMLVPHVTRQPSYGYGTSYHLDDDEESWEIATPVMRPASKMTIADYEAFLETIEADISIARQVGDETEIEDLLIERATIMAEYDQLLDALDYERDLEEMTIGF